VLGYAQGPVWGPGMQKGCGKSVLLLQLHLSIVRRFLLMAQVQSPEDSCACIFLVGGQPMAADGHRTPADRVTNSICAWSLYDKDSAGVGMCACSQGGKPAPRMDSLPTVWLVLWIHPALKTRAQCNSNNHLTGGRDSPPTVCAACTRCVPCAQTGPLCCRNPDLH
jgi:hypothetical protein